MGKDDPLFDAYIDARKAIYEDLSKEVASYQRLIITIASALAAGTLVLFEKVAQHPPKSALIAAAIGWAFLGGAVLSVARSRQLSIHSGRMALAVMGKPRWGQRLLRRAARRMGRQSHKWSVISTVCLAIGMLGVATCGFLDLWAYSSRAEALVQKEQANGTGSTEGKRGLESTGRVQELSGLPQAVHGSGEAPNNEPRREQPEPVGR